MFNGRSSNKLDTTDELARRLDFDATGWKSAMSNLNNAAKSGVDEDFYRGEAPYHNYSAPLNQSRPKSSADRETPILREPGSSW